jgi:CheY-like chemotaxis protein/DNA-directed RNA polymerase specialized sigma24 family protein
MTRDGSNNLFHAPQGVLHDVATYLPDLRRYARTLTGSQHLGDALVSMTLEDAEQIALEEDIDKIVLYRLLSRIWSKPIGDYWRETERNRKHGAPLLQRQLTRLTPLSRQAYLLVAMEHFQPAAAAAILEMPERELDGCLRLAQQQIAVQSAAKILIIEDEPLIAVDLESIVTDLGHVVVGITRTRNSAVAKAKSTRPNLILSDIKLADDSSGIDAVNEIVQFRDVPAIFITAFPERLLTGLRREPAFLITKPFRSEMVRAIIGQALFWNEPVETTL